MDPANHLPRAAAVPIAFDRRRLLQAGAVGMAGLSLPRLLASPDAGGTAKACIFIVQYGGGSQLDTFDPKPHAPEKIRGLYQPIATRVPGLQICEMLPKLADIGDRLCLIRSMTHGNGGHDGGMHICLSGQSDGGPASQAPYFGSVVAKLRPTRANLPSYVWVQNLAGDVGKRYETGNALGAAYSPLRVGTDLDNPSVEKFRFTAFDPPEGVSTDRLAARRDLLQHLEPAGALASTAAFRGFQEQAVELVTGPSARQAFDVNREPVEVRDEYGRHAIGQNLLMARRLVEAGVRLVSVTGWTGLPPGEQFRNVQTWDGHSVVFPGRDSMYGKSAFGMGWALPNLDQALSALLRDLEQRGLLDSTLVVLAGEFGRTPNFEAEDKGRGHWPACFTSLLAGGGVRGGTVYGSSDATAAYVKDRPVRPEDFGATIYHALGIEPATRFGPDGFSLQVSTGNPLVDLF